jgi:hypothetical protein
VTAPAGGGAYLWGKTLGSAGDDRGQAAAVDGSGNVLATGAFTGTIDFGTGPLTSVHFDWLNATDFKDVFLAKYTPAGTAVWVRQIGAESNDGGQAVATDANGDVVVTGYVANGVDFGNGVLTTSYGNYDIFVAKYAGTNGQYRWAKRFGTSFSEYGYGVAVDGSGNGVGPGVVYGPVYFGGGALTAVGGSADIFVAKFRGTDGQHLWSKAIGGTATDYGYGVAVDGSGNVAVVGRMSGSVDFGGGALTSAGGFDAFVAKYAGTDGHYLWARRSGGTGNDYLDAVAVNGAGDVLVAGNFPGTATFGGGTLTSAGGTDGVVVKYAGSTGAFVWQRQFGSTGDDAANGVTVDGSGNVGMTGSFTGTVDFGNGPLVAAGGMDGVAVKYTGTGVATWSKRFGGTATDYGRGVAADAGGPLNVIGAFYGTANFGGGYRASAGLFDIFLLRLGS